MSGRCSRWRVEVFRRQAVYESRQATVACEPLGVAALSVETASGGPRVHCDYALTDALGNFAQLKPLCSGRSPI
jgi:hypothetical protein